jgi:hypothetical protein
MTSLPVRKTLMRRPALALIAALLNCTTAFAAETPDDGHGQARALLSALPGTRTDQASTALPTVCLTAFAIDPQGQARALLAQGASCAELRTDGSDGGVTVASTGNQRTAYSGAQESARRMILGRGA